MKAEERGDDTCIVLHATEEQIEKIKKMIKKGWSAHFWREKKIIAIFRGKRFDFLSNDRSTWKRPIEYGRLREIPERKLDLPTN